MNEVAVLKDLVARLAKRHTQWKLSKILNGVCDEFGVWLCLQISGGRRGEFTKVGRSNWNRRSRVHVHINTAKYDTCIYSIFNERFR